MDTLALEKEIDNYLSLLNTEQKKTVLSVIKTIAMAGHDYDSLWEEKDFSKEMESRTADYENGTGRLYKFEDMKIAAISKYERKKAGK